MSQQTTLAPPGAGAAGSKRSRKHSFTGLFASSSSSPPVSPAASPSTADPASPKLVAPGSFPATVILASTSTSDPLRSTQDDSHNNGSNGDPGSPTSSSSGVKYYTAAAARPASPEPKGKNGKRHLTLFKRGPGTGGGGSAPSKIISTSARDRSQSTPALQLDTTDQAEMDDAAVATNNKLKKAIGTPFNFERKVHVDGELNWFGAGADDTGGEALFALEEKLGEGAFGCVYRATLKQTGFVLAVKEIQLHDTRSRSAADHHAMIDKEISVLKKCVHRNTVQYFGCSRRGPNRIWILTDLCGGGSLCDVLGLLAAVAPRDSTSTTPGGFPKTVSGVSAAAALALAALPGHQQQRDVCPSGLTGNEVAAVLAGAIEGLAFLHCKEIIHRDLKSANILLTLDGEVKISDFGVSEQLTQTVKNRNTVVGTPLWMSPEVILGADYATSADIWSLGITAIELADGLPPHHDENPMRILFRIPHLPPPTLAHTGKASAYYPAALTDFLSKCLQKAPAERVPAATLAVHPLIVGFSNPGARKMVLMAKARIWADALKARRDEDSAVAAAAALVAPAAPHKPDSRPTNGRGKQDKGDAADMVDTSWESVVIKPDAAADPMPQTVFLVRSDDDSEDKDEAPPMMQTVFIADSEPEKPQTVPVVSEHTESAPKKPLRDPPPRPAPAVAIERAATATLVGTFPGSPVPAPSRAAGDDWLEVDKQGNARALAAAEPAAVVASGVNTVSWLLERIPRVGRQLHLTWESRARPIVAQTWQRVLERAHVASGGRISADTFARAHAQVASLTGVGLGVHVVYISIILGVQMYWTRQYAWAAAGSSQG